MTQELYWLTLTAAIALFMPFPYVLERNFRIGWWRGLGYTRSGTAGFEQPDETPARWAARACRAHQNAFTDLATFAILILVAHAAAISDPLVLLGAKIYFFARMTHYTSYILAIPLIRSLAYITAWSGMLLMVFVILRHPVLH
ncbi:MAG: MAPEG family protein [Pseudomonadota bacterium]